MVVATGPNSVTSISEDSRFVDSGSVRDCYNLVSRPSSSKR